MKKMMKLLQSRSGQGAPLILAVVLVCLLLSCVVFEYMRLLIVAQGVRTPPNPPLLTWLPKTGMKRIPASGKGIRAATSFPAHPGMKTSATGTSTTA